LWLARTGIADWKNGFLAASRASYFSRLRFAVYSPTEDPTFLARDSGLTRVPRVGVTSEPTDWRLETINSCATGCTEFSPRLCAICQDLAKRFKITGHEGLGSTNHIVTKIFCEPANGLCRHRRDRIIVEYGQTIDSNALVYRFVSGIRDASPAASASVSTPSFWRPTLASSPGLRPVSLHPVRGRVLRAAWLPPRDLGPCSHRPGVRFSVCANARSSSNRVE
jgi:hypothetical protein